MKNKGKLKDSIMVLKSSGESCSYILRSQLYFSLHGAYLLIEFFFPTVAFIASVPSAYLGLSISLVLLCASFVALKFVDESTIREDPGHPQDAESTVSHHPSEATAFPDHDLRHTSLFMMLRSRKVLFTLLVFTLPALAETARRAFIPYFLVNRRPDQHLQEILLVPLPGEIIRIILFALFVPWAIQFVQKRYRIYQSVIDTWMIRGSLLLLAISSAFTPSATNFATEIIGESAIEPWREHLDPDANYHSFCGLCHWVRLESFLIVIHYFPSQARTTRATLRHSPDCRDNRKSHRMAPYRACLDQSW